MRRGKRRSAQIIGQREAHAIALNLGRDARATRRRRKLTQAGLGALVGLTQSEICRLELGAGAGASVSTWVAIGIALDRPVAIGFGRDVVEPLLDAGHLEAQELLIRIASSAGWTAAFEAGSNSREPRHVTDVVLRRGHVRVLVEIWNRLDDLGAAVRSSDRKLADAPDARSLWLLVDTAANHAIVRRYPAILRARFSGSATRWVAAVASAAPPPDVPGLAWIDPRARRLRPTHLVAG
jgi:transcriptional regulator with XRE-family HTH domain